MYTLVEFAHRVEKSAGIICYGTGKRFRTFEQCFSGTSVLDKVMFCIDKNENLQGTKINLENRELAIFPINVWKTTPATPS